MAATLKFSLANLMKATMWLVVSCAALAVFQRAIEFDHFPLNNRTSLEFLVSFVVFWDGLYLAHMTSMNRFKLAYSQLGNLSVILVGITPIAFILCALIAHL